MNKRNRRTGKILKQFKTAGSVTGVTMSVHQPSALSNSNSATVSESAVDDPIILSNIQKSWDFLRACILHLSLHPVQLE